MWLLPRQLHISPYVQDTEELISDCNEQSEAFAQSCLVRSKHSPAQTWSAKWKRDSWTQHLCGRTLKRSLGMSFAARWTSSLEDSPANHFPVQESGKETKIRGADLHNNSDLYTSCDNRTDELRLLGNGVVPATAELAFRTLWEELLA